jgi:SAM-dependent methyltransferase
MDFTSATQEIEVNIFGTYAHYYDLLYASKDYAGEAKFVHQLLQTYAPAAKSILELGCGTGAHAIQLAQYGYTLHGIDFSAEMLQRARQNLAQVSELATQLQFSQGDLRDVQLNEQFDAIISLFHVMSYQITNDDLRAAFATVKAHLKPNGVFIFDCWYGPAVLSDRPVVRVKRLEDETLQVTRIAEPTFHPNENVVDVNYHIFTRDKTSGAVQELQETHRMRYLFQPELDLVLTSVGLERVVSREWMTEKIPGFDTWGIYFIVRHAA